MAAAGRAAEEESGAGAGQNGSKREALPPDSPETARRALSRTARAGRAVVISMVAMDVVLSVEQGVRVEHARIPRARAKKTPILAYSPLARFSEPEITPTTLGRQ